MEMWNAQGRRHEESENGNAFDSHACRMAQQRKAYAGNKRRHRVIFILLGLLFVKFCVLLLFIIFLLTSFNGHISELQRNVEILKKPKPSCESGWLEFEGHCYFFSGFELSWTNAEKMCLNREGHLVTITSEAEQNFIINNNGKEAYWIGLTDLETEGTFKWVDGTELSYKFWRSGEPNNLLNEDCVYVSNVGKWNDYNCSEHIYALCEKRWK